MIVDLIGHSTQFQSDRIGRKAHGTAIDIIHIDIDILAIDQHTDTMGTVIQEAVHIEDFGR